MKINLIKIQCKNLKAGDLFTNIDPKVWDYMRRDQNVVGYKVYIRTEHECTSPDYDPNDEVYLVTLEGIHEH